MSASERVIQPGLPGLTALGGADTDERRARAAWSRLAEPADPVATRLIAEVGAVVALRAVADRPESVLDRFRTRLRDLDVDRDLAIAHRFGARVLIPGDDEWPPGLDDLDAPPYCLWVRGPVDLRQVSARSVAVVGARACTPYGARVAAELAAGLGERAVTVVSGAAFGIDAAAHQGALAVEGATLAVLAGGVERAYPAAHADLIDRIARTGAMVAESAPGSAPMRQRFLLRNRLIAALSQATVVVEAGLRSGARNTAGAASRLNRVVAAVPGPVTSMASAGCHEMVRSGQAVLVTDAPEVIELIGALGREAAPPKPRPQRVGDDLAPLDARVLQALALRARPVGTVATVAGLSEAECRSALGRLELAGYAQRSSAGWRRP